MTKQMSAQKSACSYSNNGDLLYSLAIEALSLIKFDGDETLLDIGCATGKITSYLSEKVPLGQVEGIDACPEMIDYARKAYPKREYKNLSFGTLDALQLDAYKQYDIITAFNSFHNVQDQRQLLKRIFYALKNQGKALLLTYPKESLYYHILEETVLSMKWDHLASQSACPFWLNKAEVKQAAKDASFCIERLNCSSDIVSFNHIEHYKDYVFSFLPSLLPLKDFEIPLFLDDLIKALKRLELIQPNGTIHIPYEKMMLVLSPEG